MGEATECIPIYVLGIKPPAERPQIYKDLIYNANIHVFMILYHFDKLNLSISVTFDSKLHLVIL